METDVGMAHPLESARVHRFLRPLALAAALAPISACAAFLPLPSADIVGVELVSLGLSSGTAAVTLDLANESSRKIEILGFLYDLEVWDSEDDNGWKRLAGGFHSEKVVLQSKRVQRVTLPVPFQYRALGAAFRSFLALGEVPYRLRGEVSVKGFGIGLAVPFQSEGVLKP